MTGAVRNEMLKRAKTKTEKQAIHLAYREHQCRLKLEQTSALLERVKCVSEIHGIENCSTEGLKCKLLYYRNGSRKIQMRVRTGLAVLDGNRKINSPNLDKSDP
jgi:hypothetical protein